MVSTKIVLQGWGPGMRLRQADIDDVTSASGSLRVLTAWLVLCIILKEGSRAVVNTYTSPRL